MTELYLKKQQEVNEPNLGQVGDIKQSILTEAQFQTIHGSQWVLCDGRSVVGSTYEAITSNSSIPDARGLFLRGKNNGRDAAEGNVSGEVDEGTEQTDSMQGHQHLANAWTNSGGAYGGVGPTYGGGANSHGLPTINYLDGGSGTPRISSETRPKNITVNYFVKID